MTTTALPTSLDRRALASRLPHRGAMCLLDRMSDCDGDRIVCHAAGHRDPRHPLRSASGLLASACIEYAAQAMALHGALTASDADAAPPGRRAGAGFLASAREVRLSRWRLDDLPPADPDELEIVAQRHAADAARILYAFTVAHGGVRVAGGRIAVVLDAGAWPR